MVTGTLHFFTLLWQQEGEGNPFDLFDDGNGQVGEDNIKLEAEKHFPFLLGTAPPGLIMDNFQVEKT